MEMHPCSGDVIEVMGFIQGKVSDRAFIVIGVLPLPVEVTETRLRAGQAATEFLVQFSIKRNKLLRREKTLSDVETQKIHQQFEDPFLAIVVNPVRTISAGKVDLGAFRTYPLQYRPHTEGVNEYQTITLNKIEGFGVHCNNYYPLEVSYFKSTLDATLLDLLWNKYWARALSTSPLVQSKDYVLQQLKDISNKVKQAEKKLEKGNPHGRSGYYLSEKKSASGKGGGQLDQIAKDAQKCCSEHVQSIMSMYIKNAMFSPSHSKN
ncbi:Cop9 signalosome subunit 5 [Gracilaria domingensis]|nr:Cop9 signalosome subunit 5 [Gracilaria domingensis]